MLYPGSVPCLRFVSDQLPCFSIDMHDSVPTGDLSELLGVLPGPSANPTPPTAPGALPQFSMDALHPYHILMSPCLSLHFPSACPSPS